MHATNPPPNAPPPSPEAPPPPWFVGGLVAMVLIVAVVALTPVMIHLATPVRFDCRQISTALPAITRIAPHRAE